MKAIIIESYGDQDQLVLKEVARPTTTDDKVLIQIKAIGINHIDQLKASGMIKHAYPLHFPWIPGSDFAGVIIECGKNISEFKPGDQVYGSTSDGGAYAEYISVSIDQIALKPASLNFIEAAAVPMAAETAYKALFEIGKLEPGQSLLIHGGAGAVGNVAIQLAVEKRIEVTVTASSIHKSNLLLLGVKECIDYKTEDFTKLGKRFDVVLDLVGHDVQNKSFEVLKTGGLLIAANQPPSEDLAKKHQVRAVFIHAKPQRESLEKIAEKIDQGSLKVGIAKIYNWKNVKQAWKNIILNLYNKDAQSAPGYNKIPGKHVLEITSS